MRIHLKCLAYLFLTLWISLAQAGSFDDFFIAIKRDDPAAIQALLRRGFDPNTLDSSRTPGLFLALKQESYKAAEALIAWPKTNVEWRSPKDESPLMLVALKGRVDLARALIARGADVNKPGWAPLHYAATGGQVDMIQLLLDENAYIDAESPNKTTPLMMAAHYGTPRSVQVLLQAGADPTLRNELGLSAVEFAQRANRPDVAEMVAAAIRSQQPKGKW